MRQRVLGKIRRPVSRRLQERRERRKRRARLTAGLRSAMVASLKRAIGLALVVGLGASAWSLLDKRPTALTSLVESLPATAPRVPVAAPSASLVPYASPWKSEPPEKAPPLAPAERETTSPQVTAPPLAPSPPIDARPAWLRNAVAVRETSDRPMIAIVIDDLGIDRSNAERVAALPPPLTLAFMSYAPDVAAQARRARAAGHELLVHVPMQPKANDLDAGPKLLSLDIPADQLRQRMAWALSRFDGYVGINNHMGSRFTASTPDMEVLFEELQRRGLLFLDSRTTAQTVAATLARRMGVPFAERDVFLDNEASADAVSAQLHKTEEMARERGFAVAIGHPHDGTIDALTGWLRTLAHKGLALVPISVIAKRNLHNGMAATFEPQARSPTSIPR